MIGATVVGWIGLFAMIREARPVHLASWIGYQLPAAAADRAYTQAVMTDGPEIRVLLEPMDQHELARFVGRHFSDMVKYVVDVQRGLIAIGGELHADAEQVLLDDGSRQADLWGANYYPGRGPDECIEFTSLINIRPARGNPSMQVDDPVLRGRIQAITFALIGRGEPLA